MKITSRQLRHIIEEEITRITEGEVVDLFPKGKPGPQDKMALAKAMAARAEELRDLNGVVGSGFDGPVDPELFMQPYIDIDGHGKEVPSLVDHVYDNYVMGMAGDYAEKLDDIIERIGIDYFDEDIEYALKSLGDDRFDGSQDHSGPPVEDWEDKAQMSTTQDRASKQDPDEIADMDLDFEKFLDKEL